MKKTKRMQAQPAGELKKRPYRSSPERIALSFFPSSASSRRMDANAQECGRPRSSITVPAWALPWLGAPWFCSLKPPIRKDGLKSTVVSLISVAHGIESRRQEMCTASALIPVRGRGLWRQGLNRHWPVGASSSWLLCSFDINPLGRWGVLVLPCFLEKLHLTCLYFSCPDLLSAVFSKISDSF